MKDQTVRPGGSHHGHFAGAMLGEPQWRKPRLGVYEPSVPAFLALMAIALAHVVTVWGYGAGFWGDQGRPPTRATS
jgi:hypothetical protein